jgi:hypothetical protein
MNDEEFQELPESPEERQQRLELDRADMLRDFEKGDVL